MSDRFIAVDDDIEITKSSKKKSIKESLLSTTDREGTIINIGDKVRIKISGSALTADVRITSITNKNYVSGIAQNGSFVGMTMSGQPIIKLNEAEELGLISNSNLDELLNDETLHSYFSDADNFDKFFLDMKNFFSDKETPQTVNSLNKYLQNLGYGNKTIQLSLDIMSKSKEEQADEKKMKEGDGVEPINKSKETSTGDERGKKKGNIPGEFDKILQKEKDKLNKKESIENLGKEILIENDYNKLVDLHNKLLKEI
jgi:hypothetical protein